VKYIMGVDPGQKGYVALLAVDDDLKLVADCHRLIKIPTKPDDTAGEKRVQVDEAGLLDALTGLSSDVLSVWVEKQWSRPGFDIKGSFKLGCNYGKLLTSITSEVGPYHEVHPTAWQRTVRDSFAERCEYEEKNLSIYAAQVTFPEVHLPKGERKNLDGLDDNAADAMLIAYYGYQMHAAKYGDLGNDTGIRG
jgi:hypothetical protein